MLRRNDNRMLCHHKLCTVQMILLPQYLYLNQQWQIVVAVDVVAGIVVAALMFDAIDGAVDVLKWKRQIGSISGRSLSKCEGWFNMVFFF